MGLFLMNLANVGLEFAPGQKLELSPRSRLKDMAEIRDEALTVVGP